MNPYRVISVKNISNKFLDVIKQNCVSKTVREMIEFMDTQHPITVLNFYATMLSNTCEDGKKQMDYTKQIFSSYINDQINFDDLKLQAGASLAALHQVFDGIDSLDYIFFTEESMSNLEVRTHQVK